MSSPGKASPQRLHHPTPVSPPRRFGRVLPLNEEDQEGDFNTVALDHTFSTSISSPKASDMTLAAVAAAATVANEAIYSQVHDTQQPVTQEVERQGGNVVGSPVRAEIAQTSPGPKRLFIHPYPRNHVMTAPLGSAPLSASEMSMATPATSAISALSSAATFSTHDPPTPSTSASVMMMDFAAASKASANTTGAGASAGYVRRPADHSMPPPQAIRIPPRKLQDGQQGYQNPPQTAPLPARSSSYDEHNHPQPPTPASAYPNLHYAQFPISSALAAAAEHHSSYPGEHS